MLTQQITPHKGYRWDHMEDQNPKNSVLREMFEAVLQKLGIKLAKFEEFNVEDENIGTIKKSNWMLGSNREQAEHSLTDKL